MSVRLAQLDLDLDPSDSYLDGRPGGVVPSPQDMLAMVRHIMRDRNDCDMIPLIINAERSVEPDRYGSDIFIEVRYAKRGWRAIYAATTTGSGIANFQCYMD